VIVYLMTTNHAVDKSLHFHARDAYGCLNSAKKGKFKIL